MCRHMYDWNIVNCDVKQPIHLTSRQMPTISYPLTLAIFNIGTSDKDKTDGKMDRQPQGIYSEREN